MSFVAAAPSQAASPPPEDCVPPAGEEEAAYEFVGSADSAYVPGDDCPDGTSTLATSVSFGNSVTGFGVVNAPMSDGSDAMSPTTQATLTDPVQLVVAYPAGLIDVAAADGGFTFFEGADDWSAPTHTTATLTDATGTAASYDVFTFTWLGGRQQATLDVSTEGTAWPRSVLSGEWAVTSDYCIPTDAAPYYSNYYAGGFDPAALDAYGTSSTANCVKGRLSSVAGWQPLTSKIRG